MFKKGVCSLIPEQTSQIHCLLVARFLNRMQPKQTLDYLEIFSIFSELQYGHRFVFGSIIKFLLQLLQCHVILIPSIKYRFVISSIYNNLSFNGGYQ